MRPVIINGRLLCQEKIAGVRRYAFEVIRGLDEILDEEKSNIDIRVVYPSYSKIFIDNLHNIQIIKLDADPQQYFNLSVVRKYVNRNNGLWCDLGNGMSYNRNGVVCIIEMASLCLRIEKESKRKEASI